MSIIRILAAFVVVPLAAAAGLSAQTGGNISRPSDNDVKTFVKQTRDNADRFVDALDGKVKDSTLRGPGGETKVSKYLDDFRDELKRTEERFKPDYSASTEVRDVLRRGTEMNTYFRAQPRGMKGESEWNRVADDLTRLAGIYGTTFPVTPDVTVRRMNDKELATLVDGFSKRSDALRKSVDDALKLDKTVDAPTRTKIVGEIDLLTKDAKALKSRLSDGQPTSAEAERMFEHAQKVKDLIAARTYGTPVTAAWSPMNADLKTVAGTFGRSW